MLWDLTDAAGVGGVLEHKRQVEGGEDIEKAPVKSTKLQARYEHYCIQYAACKCMRFQPAGLTAVAANA